MNNSPTSKNYVANQLQEVDSIPKLSDFLTELKNKDGESALSYAITAQLQVISVIGHPNLTASPFDLMLESLKTAVQLAYNEQEKTMIQQKAAVMVNSMIFFMEAKLYYENDKWNKEGQNLLKDACGMLAESALAIASASVPGGQVVAGEIGKKVAFNIFKSITENKGGFIKRIIDWFNKGERLAEYQAEFYTFLESAFEKLLRYKKLFGHSLVLRNLVLRYKDELCYRVDDKLRELQKLDPGHPVLKDKTGGARFFWYSFGIFFILLAVGFGLMYLFYLFNLVSGDKWVENLGNSSIFDTVFNIHFGILEHPVFIKIIIVLAGWLPTFFSAKFGAPNCFNSIDNIQLNRLAEIANEYYTTLADKLDEF